MKRINSFYEADGEAFKVLEVSTPLIIDFLGNKNLPHTSKSLFLLMGKMITLKQGIYEMGESENVYSMSVLLRSLIEHYLRFNYIFFKAMESKDDGIGEKFMETLYIKELHDIAKAYKKQAEYTGNVVQPGLTWSVVNEMNEKSKQMTVKDVEEEAKEFTYASIIKYIHERIDKDKGGGVNLLLNMLPAYADLSSFVHGGPFADTVLERIARENKIEKRIEEIVETVYTIFTSALLFMYLLFVQHDKRFNEFFIRIDLLIKQTYQAI